MASHSRLHWLVVCLTSLLALAAGVSAFSFPGAGFFDHWNNTDADIARNGDPSSSLTAGFAPLYGIVQQELTLSKRQCLPNGTNFCFPDNPDLFCPSCGTCCSAAGKTWCCSASATCCSGACCDSGSFCCGSVCCTKGQTCSNGQCIVSVTPTPTPTPSVSVPVPVTTITVTSTVTITRTVSEIFITTIVQNVVRTTTVVNTITTTVSNLATQTDVVFVTSTTTLLARRWPGLDLPAPTPAPLEFRRDIPVVAPALLALRQLLSGADDRPDGLGLIKRQATASRVTTTVFVTSTILVTSTSTGATTVQSTSFFTTQILQTVTRVLNAQTTVTSTSTIVFTERPPTTNTVTITGSAVTLTAPAPTEPTPTTTGESSGSGGGSGGRSRSRGGLSTGAIIGIAAGVGGAVLLAAVSSTVYFLRKRAAANKPGDYDDSPDDGFYGPGRPPALPNVEFAPNPVHHGFSTGPPPAGGYAAGLGTGNATGLATGYGAGIGGGGHGAGIGGGHGAGFGGGHDAGISGGHATGYSGGAEQGPYGQPSSNVGSPPIAPQSPPLSDHRVSSTPSGAPLLGLGVGPGGNRQSLQTTSSYNSHPGSYGPHGSSPSPEPGVGPAGGGAAYNTPGSPPTHPGVHEAPDNEVSHESQYELDSSNAVSVPLMAAYPHQQHPAYRHGRQSSYGQQYGGYNHSYQQQHQAISELDGAHAGAPHPSGDGGPSEVPGSQPGPQYYNNNNNNNNNSPQQQEGGYTYPPRYTQPSHQRIASDSSWVSEEGNGGGDPGQPGYYNDGGRSDYYRGVRGGSIGGGSYRR